ncbi:hypothetical protein H0H81_009060 [Sphagnurus paluster]|uniref:Uncharacterized protein n=1 Tax=Sphagnurus paluster TaxID=117069 RepID=A0A9P7GQ48_9AGAR|nr:hypothetical protein H0H81_009060 [Sphagnurus paluster]
MVATPEAFLLLALPSTTLSYQGAIESGVLNLECVTIQIPDASNPNVQRDVYLVLRLGSIETPIDPSRVIQRSHGSSSRIYTFQPTEFDPTTLTVTVSLPHPKDPNPTFMEDLETFETILNQYADLRNASIPGSGASAPSPTPNPAPQAIGNGTAIGSGFPGAHGDLRGHLVIVNQDNGQVLGQFDDARFRVQEDPRLHEYGHENDAVIIEVPDNRPGYEQDATALQMFARAVPPDQQDWITKSATVVR